MDRFGKLLGVNREVQTGDAEFDRQCYVDSPESDEVVKRLLAPPAVRSGISALLKLGFRVQTSTRGLEAYQVVSAYAKLRDFSSGEGAQRLLELADVMPPFDGVSPRPPGRDRNLALWANQVLDGGTVVPRQVAVRKKHQYRGEQSVYVDNWVQPAGVPVRVDATWAEYERLKVGDLVTLQTHPGAFGLEWVQPLGR